MMGEEGGEDTSICRIVEGGIPNETSPVLLHRWETKALHPPSISKRITIVEKSLLGCIRACLCVRHLVNSKATDDGCVSEILSLRSGAIVVSESLI